MPWPELGWRWRSMAFDGARQQPARLCFPHTLRYRRCLSALSFSRFSRFGHSRSLKTNDLHIDFIFPPLSVVMGFHKFMAHKSLGFVGFCNVRFTDIDLLELTFDATLGQRHA